MRSASNLHPKGSGSKSIQAMSIWTHLNVIRPIYVCAKRQTQILSLFEISHYEIWKTDGTASIINLLRSLCCVELQSSICSLSFWDSLRRESWALLGQLMLVLRAYLIKVRLFFVNFICSQSPIVYMKMASIHWLEMIPDK